MENQELNIISSLFNIKDSINDVRCGSLLVSEPFNEDRFFQRSVVLIVETKEEGCIGLVLSNEIYNIEDYLFSNKYLKHNIMYKGGPVSPNSIFILHKRPDIISDSIHINNNMYWGGDIQDIKNHIMEGNILGSDLIMYLGYSGWSQNQLEQELRIGSWHVINDDAFSVFETKISSLWVDILAKQPYPFNKWANIPAKSINN